MLYELRKEEQPIQREQLQRNTAVMSSHSINMVNSPKSQKLNAAPPPESAQEQVVVEYEPLAERYTVQNFEEYGKHEADYKYNLFSMVD